MTITILKAGAHPPMESLPEDVRPWVIQSLDHAQARMIGVMDDGRWVAVGGALFLWKGVAEVWFHVIDNDLAVSCRLPLVRGVKKLLDDLAQAAHLRRIQSVVSVNNLRAQNFNIALGFTPEATLRKYDRNGDDVIIFSRIYGS